MVTLLHIIRSEKGAVSFIAAMGFLVFVLATGIAVDYGRASLVRDKMQHAIDAAALSVALAPQSVCGNDTACLTSLARRYVSLNFPSDYMGSDFSPNNVGVDVNIGGDEVSVTIDVSARAPTSFMSIAGKNDLEVRSDVTVTYDLPDEGEEDTETIIEHRDYADMDVLFVADGSGSMGSQMCYGGEWTAIGTREECFCEDEYERDYGIDQYNWGPDAECRGREQCHEITEYECVGGEMITKIESLRRSSRTMLDTLFLTEGGANTTNNRLALVEYDHNIKNATTTNFTGNYQTLISKINQFAATGGTDGGKATQHGKNFMMGARQGEVLKVAVILTDGANAGEASDNQQIAACNAMKARGTIVHSIPFGYPEGFDSIPDRIKRVFLECASGSTRSEKLDNYFHFPESGDDLTNVLEGIIVTTREVNVTPGGDGDEGGNVRITR